MIFIVSAALLIGLSLSLFGAGGSMLAIPVFHFGLGLSAQQSVMSSLVLVCCISAVHSLRNWHKDEIKLSLTAIMGSSGAVGSWLGSQIAMSVPHYWSLIAFALCAILASIAMLSPLAQSHSKRKQRSLVLLLSAGLILGSVTGFAGVGGGFLLIPALLYLSPLSFTQAVATSLSIIWIQSSSALTAYAVASELNELHWQPVIWICAIAVLGSLLGHRMAYWLPVRRLSQGFAVFLMGIAGLTLYLQIHQELYL